MQKKKHTRKIPNNLSSSFIDKRLTKWQLVIRDFFSKLFFKVNIMLTNLHLKSTTEQASSSHTYYVT